MNTLSFKPLPGFLIKPKVVPRNKKDKKVAKSLQLILDYQFERNIDKSLFELKPFVVKWNESSESYE